jgi:hypothetical protein
MLGPWSVMASTWLALTTISRVLARFVILSPWSRAT